MSVKCVTLNLIEENFVGVSQLANKISFIQNCFLLLLALLLFKRKMRRNFPLSHLGNTRAYPSEENYGVAKLYWTQGSLASLRVCWQSSRALTTWYLHKLAYLDCLQVKYATFLGLSLSQDVALEF